MAGQARKGGITKARRVRAEHGLPLLEPIPDLLTLVERGCGVAVVIRADLGDLAGAYLPNGGKPVIFLNGSDIAPRMRFTLAHELGHHVFHDSRSEDTRQALLQPRHWREIRANAFAAELLMPEAAVESFCEGREPTIECVAAVADAFGTSLLASCLRLRTAELISQERSDALRAQIVERDDLHYGACAFEDSLSAARERLPRYPPGSALAKYGSGVASAEEQRV